MPQNEPVCLEYIDQAIDPTATPLKVITAPAPMSLKHFADLCIFYRDAAGGSLLTALSVAKPHRRRTSFDRDLHARLR